MVGQLYLSHAKADRKLDPGRPAGQREAGCLREVRCLSRSLSSSRINWEGSKAAKDRLKRGLDRIRSEVTAYATAVESEWTDDRLTFSVGAMGQMIGGRMDVLDNAVRVEVDFPSLVALLADQIAARIRQTGARLLR